MTDPSLSTSSPVMPTARCNCPDTYKIQGLHVDSCPVIDAAYARAKTLAAALAQASPVMPTEVQEIEHRHKRRADYYFEAHIGTSQEHEDMTTLLAAYKALAAERQDAHDEISRLIVETNRLNLELAQARSLGSAVPSLEEMRNAIRLLADRLLGVTVTMSQEREFAKAVLALLAPASAQTAPAPSVGREHVFTAIAAFCVDDAPPELNALFRPELVWKLVDRITRSRPSPVVQEISGEMDNTGQPEGSAQTARAHSTPTIDQRAVNALYTQEQLDQDGVMVGVSREALDHVLSRLPPYREFASDESSIVPMSDAPHPSGSAPTPKPSMVSGNVVEPGTFDLREWIGTRTGHWLTYDQCSEVIAHIRGAQPATMPSRSDGGELAALGRWAYRVTFHGTGHNEGDPASKTLTGDEFLALIPKAPQGWKLVPREPTDAMFRAFNRTRPIPREEWQAMWDAAPSPGGSE